jgi:hypothetical protein
MRNRYKYTWLSYTVCITLLNVLAPSARAFDYEAHRVINELALASLPTNFPAFALTPEARERIAFLAGEPDRWRNMPDLSLQQCNGPDHYIDLEELGRYGMSTDALPVLRYDFVGQMAVFRAAHPDQFPPPDPGADAAHIRNLVGFLPWTITEYTARLKSAFSYLKAYEYGGGTPEEVAQAQANVIYLMGVMGHFVGDGAQPLHTTVHFNGWTGENPNGYTTNHSFHAWIDGGYFRMTGGLDYAKLAGRIQPAQRIFDPARPDGVFRAVMAYLVEQNKLVEPLYRLEKEGGFTGQGDKGLAGRPFMEGQVVKAGQMLGDIWYTAWMDAPTDFYLARMLQTRQAAGTNAVSR